MIKIILKSMLARKLTTGISLFSIALAVAVLLGIERLRLSSEESFGRSITKTDLIVAASGSPLNSLLYLIYQMGDPIKTIDYKTFEEISSSPGVRWTVPISLGDSYFGFRVVGTNDSLFSHYKYGDGESLKIASGALNLELFSTVVGYEVAKGNQLRPGDKITLSHGYSRQGSFEQHDELPFTISGILAPSQTPYDRSVLISLESLEAIHFDWQSGAKSLDMTPIELIARSDLTPKNITGFLLGAKSRFDILNIQRSISAYKDESIMGVLPGVALSELWQLVGFGTKALVLVSICVAIVGLLSMFLSIYVTLNEKRKEMAIFRSLGAPQKTVVSLFVIEASLITFFGALLGLIFSKILLFGAESTLSEYLGIKVSVWPIGQLEISYLLALLVSGTIIGFVPAIQAYRQQLHQGLSTQ